MGVLTIFIIVGIIFLIREIVCWYWKVNETLELLEKSARHLERIDTGLARLLDFYGVIRTKERIPSRPKPEGTTII